MALSERSIRHVRIIGIDWILAASDGPQWKVRLYRYCWAGKQKRVRRAVLLLATEHAFEAMFDRWEESCRLSRILALERCRKASPRPPGSQIPGGPGFFRTISSESSPISVRCNPQ